MKRNRSKYKDIAPDEIFLDSKNLPDLDTDQFEGRLQSIMAYKSQFTDQEAGRGIFPTAAEIRSRVEAMAGFYGMLAGVTYAEPFVQKEVGLVDDLLTIPVKSI